MSSIIFWPESYITQPWNAHRKDRLENYLHKLVSRNQITLPEARREILNDWTIPYRSDKRVPDFIFAQGLTALQPNATRTNASDHWPVTRNFCLH
jgi:endonuclease/exonuclease/phosphatase (EEP) superfamily protein YafD